MNLPIRPAAALLFAASLWSCGGPTPAATATQDSVQTNDVAADAPSSADSADATVADQAAAQDGNPADSVAQDAAAADTAAPDTAAPDAAASDTAAPDAAASDVEPVDSKVEPDSSSDTSPAICTTTSTGNLPPGVSIELGAWPQDCTFSISAAAGKFPMPYRVTVDTATTAQVWNKPLPWGGCPFEPTGGGLAARVVISGQNAGTTQQWCICDSGLCAPPKIEFAPLQAGLWPVDFVWDGNNWIGPSDFGNKPGPAMPPGLYSFKVVSEGEFTAAPSASATMPFAFTLERTFELKP
ncbi:MAG: hypothetical protein HY902_18875 [Deltaproteobacteria bacterium]|nr:hypothetical protein [Deltaproteobacteria bacterium]